MADFHSLRSFYISALVRSGASIAEVRKLARHAKAETTLKHYAKVAPHDLRRAVESLPSPAADQDPEAPSLAATGTEGQTNRKTLAPYLPHTRDGSGRIVTADEGFDDMKAGSRPSMSMDRNPLEREDLDGSGRDPTATERRGGDSNPRGRLTHPNGLANRRFRPLSHLSEIREPNEVGRGNRVVKEGLRTVRLASNARCDSWPGPSLSKGNPVIRGPNWLPSHRP